MYTSHKLSERIKITWACGKYGEPISCGILKKGLQLNKLIQ